MSHAGALHKPIDFQSLARLLVFGMILASSLAAVAYLASEMDKPVSKAASDSAAASKGAGTVSFSAQVQPILNANCVICHQGVPGAGGMNLEPGLSYANLVLHQSVESRLMRVAPGLPSMSYINHKLLGTQGTAGGSGGRMPYSQLPLSPVEIGLIQQWISEGAPNN